MDAGPPYDWPLGRNLDLTARLPSMRLTGHMAIMVAIALGCSPIYLLGYDMDFIHHEGVVAHFYRSTVHTADDMGRYSYMTKLEGTMEIFRYCEALRDMALASGQEILNATGGGVLDVFDLADYQEIIG
jgi:hypothetical protein